MKLETISVKAGLVLTALLFINAAFAAENQRKCQCRDGKGGMLDLGAVQCVDIAGVQYLVRCEMSQNTPYWNRLSDKSGCPSA